MPQSAQERKYCDTAGGALMKHDIPLVAIKVVAVVIHEHINVRLG